MKLEKEFNAAKQVNPSLAFVTTVSKFVAQGACRNYRNAHSRWRNKSLKARKPVFHRKNRTGTGAFLAASGIATVQYDGHRRIRLPYIGNVKLTRQLSGGIPYEVTISKRNGRWYASIAYWKSPLAPPDRETQSVGGADLGINPWQLTATASSTRTRRPTATRCANWLAGNGPRRGDPSSRGWWEAQRRLDQAHRRVTGLRNDAHHHVSRELVASITPWALRPSTYPHAKSWAAIQGAGRRRNVNLLDRIRYKASWYGTRILEADQWFPSSKTCSACGVVNRDLGRQPSWTCPNCGAQHDRNRNADRNLRKLALLAVGENVTLLDGEALAGDYTVAGETAPAEGRTKPMTLANSQPRLAL